MGPLRVLTQFTDHALASGIECIFEMSTESDNCILDVYFGHRAREVFPRFRITRVVGQRRKYHLDDGAQARAFGNTDDMDAVALGRAPQLRVEPADHMRLADTG